MPIHGLCAVEIPAASSCNLDCVYCYIPKCKSLTDIHNKWRKIYQSGEFIDVIKRSVGNQLETLALWGTEPSIGFKDILSHIPRLKKEFPRLKSITSSSNLILIDNIIYGLDQILANDLSVELQISLDGPEYITDANRGVGVTKKVVANIMKLGEYIEKRLPPTNKLRCVFKPTSTIEEFKRFVNEPNTLQEYIIFFDEMLNELFTTFPSSRKYFTTYNVMPTCVMPGKYTKEDGEIYSKYCYTLGKVVDKVNTKVLSKSDIRIDQVYIRTEATLNSIPQWFNSYRLFHDSTCSGGRSMYGVDMNGSCHICHRSYWMDDPGYSDYSVQYNKDHYDSVSSSTTHASIYNMTHNYSAKPSPIDNNYNIKRLAYSLTGYTASFQLRFNFTVATIAALQSAKQVLDIYTVDNIHTYILAAVLCTRYECPADHILYTGTPYTHSISMIKLLGNGAVYKATEDLLNGKYGTTV